MYFATELFHHRCRKAGISTALADDSKPKMLALASLRQAGKHSDRTGATSSQAAGAVETKPIRADTQSPRKTRAKADANRLTFCVSVVVRQRTAQWPHGNIYRGASSNGPSELHAKSMEMLKALTWDMCGGKVVPNKSFKRNSSELATRLLKKLRRDSKIADLIGGRLMPSYGRGSRREAPRARGLRTNLRSPSRMPTRFDHDRNTHDKVSSR